MVTDSLQELLVNLLPSERKLVEFRKRPLVALNDTLIAGDRDTLDRTLLLWSVLLVAAISPSSSKNKKEIFILNCLFFFRIFESHLKQLYSRFIDAVEQFLLHDQLVTSRVKVVTVAFSLLVSRSEAEARLLRMLVNKLGDLDSKVTNKATEVLKNLGLLFRFIFPCKRLIYAFFTLVRRHPNMKHVIVSEVETFIFRPRLSERAQ